MPATATYVPYLTEARKIARNIANRKKNDGTVSVDQVRTELEQKLGFSPSNWNTIARKVFDSPSFYPTSATRPSTYPAARRREVVVWKYAAHRHRNTTWW